uniref:Uncharacterized protein n=1 Tax=Vitis vinifera TaxID=29760 RepID=A5BYI8_VITVI|nr:hypothetical protein VITISV_035358 [Vitis vinifera]
MGLMRCEISGSRKDGRGIYVIEVWAVNAACEASKQGSNTINAVRPLFVGAVIEIRSVTFVYLAALALSVDDFQVLLTVPVGVSTSQQQMAKTTDFDPKSCVGPSHHGSSIQNFALYGANCTPLRPSKPSERSNFRANNLLNLLPGVPVSY